MSLLNDPDIVPLWDTPPGVSPTSPETATTPAHHAPAARNTEGNSDLHIRHTAGVVQSRPATDTDRAHLSAHIGRDAIQATQSRSFATGWRPSTKGAKKAKLYRVGTDQLARCQYAVLRHQQRAAVFAVDIDRTGNAGGAVENIDTTVLNTLRQLAAAGAGPSWIGVNPINGKTHLLWMVDPVYADKDGDSPNMRLYEATWKAFRDALGGDRAFSNWWMRSPFYLGGDERAYIWHCQHHRVDGLDTLIKEVRAMTGTPGPSQQDATPSYNSGRERLEAAIARRKEAEAFKAVVDDVAPDITDIPGETIDGVRVRWADENQTRADRDETAFRYALAEAHRLRKAGKRMSDAVIIDAYERAYRLAQAVGADGRVEEMPPMRDRLTMARRVRGYVISGKTSSTTGAVDATGRADSRERKILATLGRRGGQKAAQRWKTDPDGDYAQQERERLEKSNTRRVQQGKTRRLRIAAWFLEGVSETGEWPTVSEAVANFQVSERTVRSALRDAGITLPRGRRKKPATP